MSAVPSRVRELLLLSWPTVLSYILNNAYRINDQFWIQGLGGTAQAAVGAVFFAQILVFALVFLGEMLAYYIASMGVLA